MRTLAMNRRILGAALASLLIPVLASGGEPKRAGKVWTNDDFPQVETAANHPEPQAGPNQTAAAALAASEAREKAATTEARLKLLTTALNRQKTLEETTSLMKTKLEQETDEFRREVYDKILNDTVALSQANRKVIDSFLEEPKAAASKDREPKTVAQKDQP